MPTTKLPNLLKISTFLFISFLRTFHKLLSLLVWVQNFSSVLVFFNISTINLTGTVGNSINEINFFNWNYTTDIPFYFSLIFLIDFVKRDFMTKKIVNDVKIRNEINVININYY